MNILQGLSDWNKLQGLERVDGVQRPGGASPIESTQASSMLRKAWSGEEGKNN